MSNFYHYSALAEWFLALVLPVAIADLWYQITHQSRLLSVVQLNLQGMFGQFGVTLVFFIN